MIAALIAALLASSTWDVLRHGEQVGAYATQAEAVASFLPAGRPCTPEIEFEVRHGAQVTKYSYINGCFPR